MLLRFSKQTGHLYSAPCHERSPPGSFLRENCSNKWNIRAVGITLILKIQQFQMRLSRFLQFQSRIDRRANQELKDQRLNVGFRDELLNFNRESVRNWKELPIDPSKHPATDPCPLGAKDTQQASLDIRGRPEEHEQRHELPRKQRHENHKQWHLRISCLSVTTKAMIFSLSDPWTHSTNNLLTIYAMISVSCT